MNTEINIFQKIQMVKGELLKKNLKKSGNNKFAGYSYYELSDFVPTIIELCGNVGLFTKISFTKELAILTIVNTEKPEESVEYTSPMEELELKGCNKIQALGGTETYSRRYLYMTAFDIVENDMFDSVINEITTKEEAEKYQLTFGKHSGRTMKDLCENETKYIDWLLKNSNDGMVLKSIELITGKKKMTEEEQDEHLEYTQRLMELIRNHNIDLEAMLDHYNTEKKEGFTINDLSLEQYKNAIEVLEKKYEHSNN